MTVMLLALMMGDAALAARCRRYNHPREGGAISEPYVVAPVRPRLEPGV